MSRLYVESATDMIKTKRTARAKNWMRTSLYFNPDNYNDYVSIRCKPDGKKGMLCEIFFKGYEKIGEIVATPEGAKLLNYAKLR